MTVWDIIESIDILDYISQYCELEERSGEYWGLSPFTEEKTPSFSVNTEQQLFYDFSSGVGGNVLSFAKKYHKCSTVDAIKLLAKYAGIDDSAGCSFERLNATRIARKFIRRSNVLDKKITHKNMPNDAMDRYEFDESKFESWIREGISLQSIKRFNVAYDRLSNRIMFPIKDENGNIISISGRTLDKDYKEHGVRKYTYINSVGAIDTLYGLYENIIDILQKKEIILFEGAKSVMLADTYGFKNTAALLTSHLNKSQMLILAKLGIRAVFALDKGVNIRNDKNIMTLKKYIAIEYIEDNKGSLKDKMAPVDAGANVWKELYKNKLLLI